MDIIHGVKALGYMRQVYFKKAINFILFSFDYKIKSRNRTRNKASKNKSGVQDGNGTML